MERERKIEILKDLLIQLSDSANILCTCEADERCEVIEEYIKALEDKVIITMDKGTLKCSNQGYVIYNKDWFRKHFATEVEIITGYDGYIKQPTSDDCVSRQAVLEKINDWWGITSTSGEPTLCDYIRELPPVTPTQRWIPVSEKSPEKPGRYLTYIVNKHDTNIQYIMTCEYYEGDLWNWFPDDDCASDNVVAWMPLPEPYKAESEE